MNSSIGLFSWTRVVALLLLGFAGPALGRTWTDVQGRTISARFMSQTETDVTVRLTANNREFTIPKERLSEADRDHLAFLAQHEFGESFAVDPSGRSSPAYVVVEAGTLFRLPEANRVTWLLDLDQPGVETRPEIESPFLVEQGITRLEDQATRQKLVLLGAEDYELLQKVWELPFFEKLRLQQRQALMAVLAADKLEHGDAARTAVRALFDDESFLALPERDQEEMFLRQVEESSPDLERNFEVVQFHESEVKPRWRKENRYTAFQIEEPVEAWENEVKVARAGRVQIFSLK